MQSYEEGNILWNSYFDKRRDGKNDIKMDGKYMAAVQNPTQLQSIIILSTQYSGLQPYSVSYAFLHLL
jgi:hypothetical protein